VNRLLEQNACAFRFNNTCHYDQPVIEPGRLHKSNGSIDQTEANILFGYEPALIDPSVAQPFGSAAFHEAQIIGKVHDSLRIGIFVIDAHCQFIPVRLSRHISKPFRRN
jgi:hypothetical protein